jgi:hypothetical protein
MWVLGIVEDGVVLPIDFRMEKRRDAMHKKDREERYSAKMKGIARYYPETRTAPKPKGITYYKRRRALGNG